MPAEGSVDVLVSVGQTQERIEAFPPLADEPEQTIVMVFEPDGAVAVSVTFAESAFLCFVSRLIQFARNLPGGRTKLPTDNRSGERRPTKGA